MGCASSVHARRTRSTRRTWSETVQIINFVLKSLCSPSPFLGSAPPDSLLAEFGRARTEAAEHREQLAEQLAEHNVQDDQDDLSDLAGACAAVEDVEPKDAEHTCSERYNMHRTETHVTHVTRLQEPQQSWPFCCCSAGSWELELLRAGAELEKRLQDPQFVAQRCDLDSSGDLDLQELKQAARVFGMKLSMERLEELMAGRPRISKLQFAEMVADFQVSTSKSRRTVPHSLRGMALGQLEHLEAVFVTSGWLAAKCEEFNLEHAEAIQGRRLFKQSPNLYAMDSWVVTPMSKPGSCPARDQDCQQTVPQAYEETSFSELVNAFGLVVHCFVSHYWGHIFSKTLAALRLWAKAHYWKAHLGQPQSMVFWICLFALNQHEAAEEVGEDPMQGPFNAALAQAEQGAVLILDEEINPFKRIWCLFELSRLHDLGKPLELICDLGSMSDPEARHLQPGMQEMLHKTCKALWNTAASTALSSRQDDKYRIWGEITNCEWKRFVLRFGARVFIEMERDRRSELHEMFSEFDCYVQSLLSTSLLQFLLVHRNYEAAAECCLHGAVTKEDAIDQICSNFPTDEERRSWLNAMLVSRVDDEPMLKLLLNHQADVAARRESDGAPALVLAAERGHDSAAKLLLVYGADVAIPKIDGVTALIGAAQGGHASTAKLLLENRADLEATKRRGSMAGGTALYFATAWGNESVVKVLLDSKASMTGAFALEAAAKFGHEALVKLFLDHKACVNVWSELGEGTQTPLMLAAEGGHVAALKVLLEGRADVAATAPDGRTALVSAAQGEHVLATKLLLHWGAGLPPQETMSVHYGILCDGCRIKPIVGCRFMCMVCSGATSYDLCQNCFDKKGILHAGRCADHAFDRLDVNQAAMFLQRLQ